LATTNPYRLIEEGSSYFIRLPLASQNPSSSLVVQHILIIVKGIVVITNKSLQSIRDTTIATINKLVVVISMMTSLQPLINRCFANTLVVIFKGMKIICILFQIRLVQPFYFHT